VTCMTGTSVNTPAENPEKAGNNYVNEDIESDEKCGQGFIVGRLRRAGGGGLGTPRNKLNDRF
jgi:hypothetical protein